VGAEVTTAGGQADYEAALGAFLVAFNGIENAAVETIVLALKKAGREEISPWITDSSFERTSKTLP
jgi:hypothetical protein